MSELVAPERLEVWRGFVRFHAAIVAAIERDLAAAGLIPLTWYDVLIALVYAPDNRLRMGELAERMVLNRSSLTHLAARLEQEGLLERQPVVGDRRGAMAVLTASGREAVVRAWPVYARAIHDHFARWLSDDQVEGWRVALARMLDSLAPTPR